MYYTQCYEDHNRGAEGGYGDFPLCSAELEVHTHTCPILLSPSSSCDCNPTLLR